MELTVNEWTAKFTTDVASVKGIAIKAIESSSEIQLIEKPKDQ